MSTTATKRHPAWCNPEEHRRSGSHQGSQVKVPMEEGRGDLPKDMCAHLTDIGTTAEPKPVVWVGWEGVGRAQLLTPEEARQYGLHLLTLTALAEG